MKTDRVWNGAKLYEEKVFKHLESCLPEDYVLLNNRRLKGPHSFREFDLIILGKYAVYIVEVKHLIGKVIRGNNEVWRLDSYLDPSAVYEIASPLRQLWDQELFLEKKIGKTGLKIAVVECVCIIADEKPEMQIDDVPENLAKIFWYKDLEGFLTDYEQIPSHLRTKYKINEKTDNTRLHKRLKDLIDSNFTRRVLERVGPYEIEGEAWRTSRYIAYYAHSSERTSSSNRVLLKLYKNPSSSTGQNDLAVRKREVNEFVNRLNARANNASLMMNTFGDPITNGAKYVIAVQKAFLVGESTYAVVSEWIEGQPLSYFLKNPPSAKYLCTIAAQICRGLAFIHSAKVFHRNLSTDNIIWSPSEREIKIINFHFARLIGKKTVLANERMVDGFIDEINTTKRYQAPELQKTGALGKTQPEELHNANAVTDTYSLGVVLLELFGGLFGDKDTVDGRLKEIGHLDTSIKKIIQTYCSSAPQERATISLVDAAEIFERLAGNVLPDQDLFNLAPENSLGFYEIIKTLETTELSIIYLAKYVLAPGDQKVVIKVHKTASRGATIRKELWDAIQLLGDIDNQFTARLLQTEKAYLFEGRVLLQPIAGAREAYYQIWEFIPGEDLDEYLDTRKPYSLATATREQLQEGFSIAAGVLRALGALHRKKWIHRDIKPKNFMLTPEGQIKIIDFGLSKRSGDSQIVLGGTPCYIPPEAYSNNEWSELGDVWAAGCVVTYILTGEEVCASNDADQAIERIKEIRNKLGVEIMRVLAKAVENLPENRYPSAMEFSKDFEEAYQLWQSSKERSGLVELQDDELTDKSKEEDKMKTDYSRIITKLKEKLDDADLSGDLAAVDTIKANINALDKWLAGGQKGKCPVELDSYDLEQTTPAPPSVVVADTAGDQQPQPEPLGKVQEVKAKEPSSQAPSESTTEMDLDSDASEEADHQQENLRQELGKVRQHMEKQEWREAVALAGQVEALARGQLKETARDLLSQTQVRLSKELEKVLAKGDAARAKHQDEKAQAQYRAALNLDPANSHARLALQELDGMVREKVSKEQEDSLRAGLNDRRDIHRLGEAVYDAEALEAEGKLPSKLLPVLKEARAYYEATRSDMGEMTTAMRYGDIAMRAEAVAKIENLVRKDKKTIYDATTNSDKPAYDVLREAQALLQQASEDTAQHELNIAEKFKILRPRYVHQRLTTALEQPFYELEKHKLEEKLAEVGQYIQAQEKAESLQEQADEESDPVHKLGVLLQAKQTFGSVAGLESQIAQTRPLAISLLRTVISDALQRAELFIRNQEYAESRSATTDAETQVTKWPEEQLPEEILRLLNKARELRQQVDDTENAWKEYTRLASDIRQKVLDQNQRAAGLGLFKQVSEDERFKSFSDLRTLTSEIDQYKGGGEQLNDANTARDKGNWSRVFEIADKVLKAGTAGKLAPRFQELHADAVTELNILRAQELLESDEIPEANNTLSATLKKERERSPERETLLRERLSGELERIQQAINGNKSMQSLYDQACDVLNLRDSIAFKAYTSPSFALRQARVGPDGEVNSPEMRALLNKLKDSPKDADPSPKELSERVEKMLLAELSHKGIDERLKALHLFRYIGDEKTQAAQPGWPPYSLSLRTAEARHASRLMTDSLRADVYEPLAQKYRECLGQEDSLKDEALHELSNRAEALRESYLLETENERAVGRWAEVEWGKRHAYQEEKQSNWQTAVEVWKRLDNHHPGVTTVKRGLRNARIKDGIHRAYYLVHNDHKGQDAIHLLKSLQAEPDLSNSWELHLALAETYESLGEFDAAFGNLDQAQRVIGGMDDEPQKATRLQLEQQRKELESRQVIYTYSEIARNKMLAGNPAEAIRVLQAGMENSKLMDLSPIRNLRDEIFVQSSQELLQRAKEEQTKGSDEGKVQAVTALVDLQVLEELTEQPNSKRRSTAELNRLRADLAPVADAVVRTALDFDPTIVPLAQAIDTAAALSARLQTFDNVLPSFGTELEPVRERLTKRHRDVASTLENLRTLEKILQDANRQDLWEAAIRTGDFEILEQYLARINKLELNSMQEVRAFEKRLSETQEIYRGLLDLIGQIRHRFSMEEDFGFVKTKIIESEAQPAFRENGQTWQVIHAQEYREIRGLLDNRLHVPDVYGRGDLVGWQKVLAQADEREKELELWQEWHRQCEFHMESASRAISTAEAQPADMPTRNKKADWEKVSTTAQSAISALSYPLAEKVTDLADGDVDVPIRSKAAKLIEEDGKKWKKMADLWLRTAQAQIDALQAVLDEKGFPSAEEFSSTTVRGDWDYLEKLLVRAREAGITNENERLQVITYANVLEQKRKEQHKKRFRLW